MTVILDAKGNPYTGAPVAAGQPVYAQPPRQPNPKSPRNHMNQTYRPFPGSGGLYLSTEEGRPIDPLDPVVNPNAGLATILHFGRCALTRWIRTPFWLLVVVILAGGGIALFKSAILVAARMATPVSYNDMTDRTSATQVGHVLGSQLAAPALQVGTGLLVQWASDGQINTSPMTAPQSGGGVTTTNYGALNVSTWQPAGQQQSYNGTLQLNPAYTGGQR